LPSTFTPDQQKAIRIDGTDICVTAGAGCGKTGVLVNRFVRIVTESRSGVMPQALRAAVDEILVITFTDKATREIKGRIIDELLRQGLNEDRRLLDGAFISTIHGFCSRVLRENPFEVGLDPKFTVLDAQNSRRLLRNAVEQAVESAYATDDSDTRELIAAILSMRRHGEEQPDPVATLADAAESVMRLLRSAGRTLAEVESHCRGGAGSAGTDSDETVRTFVESIAFEVRSTAMRLQEHYDQFSGASRDACDSLLDCARAVRPDADLVDTIEALRELMSSTARDLDGSAIKSQAQILLLSSIDRIKGLFEIHRTLFERQAAVLGTTNDVCRWMLRFTALVWRAYDDAKRRSGQVDTDDLQAECVRLFEDHPEILACYQNRLRYLMVDELQDTNSLQMKIISLLHVTDRDIAQRRRPAGRASAQANPERNYLFVVGDFQQSIYGFRGAEPAIFRSLEKTFSQTGASVSLSTNFRSRPEILRLTDLLFSQLWSRSEAFFTPLQAGVRSDEATEPRLEFFVSKDLTHQGYRSLEPSALAARVQQMVEGKEIVITRHGDPRRGAAVGYGDIAILLRQFTDIEAYEEAFTSLGVPCSVVGGGRGFVERPEIRDLLNALTVLDTPFDDLALLAVLRSPLVGVEIDTLSRIVAFSQQEHQTDVYSYEMNSTGNSPNRAIPLFIALQRSLEAGQFSESELLRIAPFFDAMTDLRNMRDRVPVGQILERLIVRFSYDARLLCRPNGRRRLANIRTLLQLAHSEPRLSLAEFIKRTGQARYLSNVDSDNSLTESDTDVVRMYTMHGAKGLEFPVVFLADLSRSLDRRERALFLCDPGTMAIGTRIGREPDPVYMSIDAKRTAAYLEEADRLLYVAMTRAREHLVLCGNLGRNRGTNWGDKILGLLDLDEIPPEPAHLVFAGDMQARISPLHFYSRLADTGIGSDSAGPIESDADYADRLARALLTREPLTAGAS